MVYSWAQSRAVKMRSRDEQQKLPMCQRRIRELQHKQLIKYIDMTKVTSSITYITIEIREPVYIY